MNLKNPHRYRSKLTVFFLVASLALAVCLSIVYAKNVSSIDQASSYLVPADEKTLNDKDWSSKVLGEGENRNLEESSLQPTTPTDTPTTPAENSTQAYPTPEQQSDDNGTKESDQATVESETEVFKDGGENPGEEAEDETWSWSGPVMAEDSWGEKKLTFAPVAWEIVKSYIYERASIHISNDDRGRAIDTTVQKVRYFKDYCEESIPPIANFSCVETENSTGLLYHSYVVWIDNFDSLINIDEIDLHSPFVNMTITEIK